MSDGFLSRWARRKEAVRAVGQDVGQGAGHGAATSGTPGTPLPDGLPDPAEASQAIAPGTAAAAPETEEDTLAALPSLDALTSETDLSPFLRAGVPAALRNAALRRMWSLDPAIRDFVSEAREYAYDWNTPGGAPGFGPLLPSDDVKAMLKRLVSGPETRAGTPPRDEAPPEASAGETPEADTADPDPGETDDPVAAALPRPEEPAIPATVVPAEPVAETVVAPAPVRPRLRRHGGAMPA